MDFRLMFGCQTKVTGLFRTQLEDGIMGMDNRKGAFWRQLREHLVQRGYHAPDEAADDAAAFDPHQFSLCFDRQSLSQDLRSGVGAGALTLGGADPLFHHTDMVFAENVAPEGGWYTTRVRALFLRTGGGTLARPPKDGGGKHLRVDADEEQLNGSSKPHKGVIVDSGTTDSYLPGSLKGPFQEAWKLAMGKNDPFGSKYHNRAVAMSPKQVKSLPTILVVLQGHAPSNAQVKEGAPGLTRAHQEIFQAKGDERRLRALSDTDVVVAIPPTHYMEESSSNPGTYTARLYFTEKYGGQPIFGSIFMMGHDINFDVGAGRIGFAESHCDYSRYLEERDAAQQQQ